MAPAMITRSDIEATFRRPGPLLPPNAPAAIHPSHLQTSQAAAAEHLAAQKRVEDARNRSRRPVDRDLPAGLSDLAIGDGVVQYRKLRDVERKLDAVMMRKRADVTDPVQKGLRESGAMRVWISNTCENQPWQASGMDPHAFDFSSNVEATFKVKIEGRILDTDAEDEEAEATKEGETAAVVPEQMNEDGTEERATKRARLSAPPPRPRKKFSHYFKSIAIKFDRPPSFQPDGYTQIKWIRPDIPSSTQTELPREADFDSLTFERKADENMNITVELVPDEQPERYRLSKELSELLDIEEADRQTILMGIWEYVKHTGLQGDEEQRHITCDERLRTVRLFAAHDVGRRTMN